MVWWCQIYNGTFIITFCFLLFLMYLASSHIMQRKQVRHDKEKLRQKSIRILFLYLCYFRLGYVGIAEQIKKYELAFFDVIFRVLALKSFRCAYFKFNVKKGSLTNFHKSHEMTRKLINSVAIRTEMPRSHKNKHVRVQIELYTSGCDAAVFL